MSQEKKNILTAAQKSRIERNRAKALNLRKAKLVSHPCAAGRRDASIPEKSVIKVQGTKYVDSGGGFLIEESLNAAPVAVEGSTSVASVSKNIHAQSSKQLPAQLDDEIVDQLSCKDCLECGTKFSDSYLLKNFAYSVCDKCRDVDGKHSLITRTEAKAEYLLKDCDFDRREPPLKFISRKNPHNIRWGEMKLYLHLQVEKRALEVWGTEEELMRQQEDREEKRELSKAKKYNKQIKQLRMDVRSSLYSKKTQQNHTHDFGPETYNENDDSYSHVCLTCQYSEVYEKM